MICYLCDEPVEYDARGGVMSIDLDWDRNADPDYVWNPVQFHPRCLSEALKLAKANRSLDLAAVAGRELVEALAVRVADVLESRSTPVEADGTPER